MDGEHRRWEISLKDDDDDDDDEGLRMLAHCPDTQSVGAGELNTQYIGDSLFRYFLDEFFTNRIQETVLSGGSEQ